MSGPTRDGGMMADINVTPFVDVMLVLLIIFMVTAPMMTTGVALDLPHAEAPSLAVDEDQLVLSVTGDETYYLGKNAFPLDELKLKLAAIAKENPDQQLFVRADGRLAYEKVLQLLAVAQNAGVVKVGLVTQPGAVSEGLGDDAPGRKVTGLKAPGGAP